ncbi:MAG: hypothetical protein RLY93_09800 [Sumerlaeia bacterium]
MIFFALPLGLMDVPLRRRGILAYVIAALIAWRLFLAMIWSPLQVNMAAWLPVRDWDARFLSAFVQSLFTPGFLPGMMPADHMTVILLAVASLVLFWLLFGPALEDRLGRVGLSLLYLGGAGVGVLLGSFPAVFAVSHAFWLGLASGLVCLGACYVLFALEDVRFAYALWIFPFVARTGEFTLPGLVILIPLHLLLMATQALAFYKGDTPIPDGAIPAIAWTGLLPLMAAAVIWCYGEVLRWLGGKVATEKLARP